MGIYSEYLSKNMDFIALTTERKQMLAKISALRAGRDILVMASDLTKNVNNSIEYADILPFQDQLSNLKGKAIDIIIETPGGFAEVVEDIVKLIRQKYDSLGIIVPGYSKSAGTIFAMAADEILMGAFSALGPIDAQIFSNGKHFSADAFLDGLEKIKQDVIKTGRLNPALIPMLQNISPGEIQHCENAQNFSKILVKAWLSTYKFKNWCNHSSTGLLVTDNEKDERAEIIASKLCKHADWLTHGRSIKLDDLQNMKLKINDYSANSALNDAITRYYTLLRMTFETTNIYKIFETIDSQIYRFTVVGNPQLPIPNLKIVPRSQNQMAVIDFVCPNCKNHVRFQANIGKHSPLQSGNIAFPVKDNQFQCPRCKTVNNILPIKLQIEAEAGQKIVE
jgi:phage FluMu protein Com